MNAYRAKTIVQRMEENSCQGKREYVSMREAKSAAESVGNKIGDLLLAYQCPFCYLFHIGHPPSRKRLEAERKLKRYRASVKTMNSR